MPISVHGGDLRALTQDEFHAVDRVVMGITFKVHNQFGRLLDELLYKREIATRCMEAGLLSEREVKVKVSYRTFVKEYFVDLLLSRGVIFEVKAADVLNPVHESQALNYLFLTGTRFGKLINLRPDRVQWRFISTGLTPESRKKLVVIDREWCECSPKVSWLKNTMTMLLLEWGAFLELNLYREALIHFLGGPEAVVRPIELYSDNRMIGLQEVDLLTEDTAFVLTSLNDSKGMRIHLRKFLLHTPLRWMQWINLNHHQIEFTTLAK